MRITDWLIQKTPKKSKTDQKDRYESNDHESREKERMNIYSEKTKIIYSFAKNNKKFKRSMLKIKIWKSRVSH